MGGEKTLPRAIIGVWNKKNRCGIKRLPSEEMLLNTTLKYKILSKYVFRKRAVECSQHVSQQSRTTKVSESVCASNVLSVWCEIPMPHSKKVLY